MSAAGQSKADLIATCPFCGCDDTEVLTSSIGFFWGKCGGCGAEGPVKNFRFAATEAWNTRTALAPEPEPQPVAEDAFLDFAKKALDDAPASFYGDQIKADVFALCTVFSGQRHSGASARQAVRMFGDLVAWKEFETTEPQPVAVVVQNPIEELRLAALTAYPALQCTVSFASFPDEGPYGVTVFPNDGSAPQVQVAVGIPMEAVIEVMAHELAHVAVGLDADHGPAWDAAFDRIHQAYNARAASPHLAETAPDQEGQTDGR